jgi:hypothetical protein
MGDYSTSPAVHIFADTEAALARMRGTAAAAGCRVASHHRIGLADAQPVWAPGASLVIDLEDEDGLEAALPLVDRALRDARKGVRRSVISTSPGLLDLVVARAWHADIVHLCEADEQEWRTAIARTCERPVARLQESRRERDFPILPPVPDTVIAPSGPRARVDAAFIRMLLRTRRLRAHFFRADLFADPVWDMLLDLLATRLEGKQVAVSSLCIAAAVPPTTALRWIGVLTESGMVVRVADRSDGRRVYIELAEPTAHALCAWLQEARRMLTEVL